MDIPANVLLQTLAARFRSTMPRHPALSWETVESAIHSASNAIPALQQMEATGGEPNVVTDPTHAGQIVFMDCSPESPAGRRSLCYDHEALLARKSNPPADSAVNMASSMGIELLTEAQYKALQSLGNFDGKTSSWIHTPAAVRSLGGALFCDRRYGQVFLYHNGADSYYSTRGFRGYLAL